MPPDLPRTRRSPDRILISSGTGNSAALGSLSPVAVPLWVKPRIGHAEEPKLTAMLADVRSLEARAIDDALDLFAVLMASRLISRARRASQQERLATLPKLERASRTLAAASGALIGQLELAEDAGADLDVAALWNALEPVASRLEITAARQIVERLVPDEEDDTAHS